MDGNATSFATIVAMALVTYATRAGGLWLMGRFEGAHRFDGALSYVPGSVLVAIVAPTVIAAGPAGLVAVLLTAVVARLTGSVLLAMLVGVGLVWAARSLFPA
jgi:uncharacterized membrane protein